MIHPPADSEVELLSAPKLSALVAELNRFAPPVRERGRQYAGGGLVGDLRFAGTGVYAPVHGTSLYDTLWEWHDGGWYPDCSCPVGPYCKHAYAVGCCMLTHEDAHVDLTDPAVARLLPARVRTQRALIALPAVARPARKVAAVPRALTGSALAVQRLRAAHEPWARQQYLIQLLGRAPMGSLDLGAQRVVEILSEPDPDLLCWRLAREIAQQADGWLPDALEPYRQRPDLSAQHAAQTRTAFARELVAWVQRRREPAQRHLRLVFTFERLHGAVGIGLETRVTSPRLTDKPRTITQLQQLRSELRSTPGLLAPEQAGLLEWLVDESLAGSYYEANSNFATRRRLSGRTLKSLLSRIADSHGAALATWAADLDPELAARGGVTPGGPVRLRSDAARLLPSGVARDGTVCVDFLFLWPDGRQRALGQTLYFRGMGDWSHTQPSLVLADGEFSLVMEEPPQELVQRFRESGGLPLPPAERARILGTLATHFPHVRDTLAPHTRLHAVTAAIALDLREDDWLQLRLFAYTGEDGWQPGHPVTDRAIVFEYQPNEGWVRRRARAEDPPEAAYGAIVTNPVTHEAATPDAATAAPTSAPLPVADVEVWIEGPDPVAVEPAATWLTGTDAQSGTKRSPNGRALSWPDREVGWWMPANARRMAAFAELWEQRPPGVVFFGTERVRRLLSGQDRVTPRLRIESSGLDWFAVSAEWATEGVQLTDTDLAKLRTATTKFVKLPSGWVHRDVAALHEETLQVLADLGLEPGQGEQRVTMWQLAGAKPESLAALARLGANAEAVRAAEALRVRIACFTGMPHVAPPARLTAQLRPYQQQGLDFLVYTTSLGIGAVLADDMGLGKTVQALAWLEHLRAAQPDGGPTLVVCPASVVHNWAREAATFVPGLRVLLLTRGQERHALRSEIPVHDLIVTNYALLRRDLATWRDIEWRAVILDEAQNIKNPDAVVTKAALELRARHRLALTGTPLENRALDLWSILSFVNPGYLGHRAQFSARFDRLDAAPHVRTLLAAKLRPVLLRRMKQEVATDLPERIEERRDCELTKGQRQLYLVELQRSRALVDKLSAAPGGVRQNKIAILAALTRLRQICCHPALARGQASLGSGKFEALFELLEPLLAEGHKVLLFSQFVQCLKLLSAEMERRGIARHTLTGQSLKREQIVAAFQHDPDPCVFLISLKAGGTGLNLTAASYVVLFDPWWNPAVEAQAIDRTHRIGQDRTVIAYRMLTQGTIEEKIWELQQRKAALARDILGEDGFARSLNRADLDYLLADATAEKWENGK